MRSKEEFAADAVVAKEISSDKSCIDAYVKGMEQQEEIDEAHCMQAVLNAQKEQLEKDIERAIDIRCLQCRDNYRCDCGNKDKCSLVQEFKKMMRIEI